MKGNLQTWLFIIGRKTENEKLGNVSFVSQGKTANYFVLSLLPSLRNLAVRVNQEWSETVVTGIFSILRNMLKPAKTKMFFCVIK